MNNLEFIQKLYNGKNCYSDHMGSEELNVLHIVSNVENIIKNAVDQKRIVFITGNPGDGKTFLIKSLGLVDVFTITDLNNEPDYNQVAQSLKSLYDNRKPAVVAANEYPFRELKKAINELNGSTDFYNEIEEMCNTSLVYDPTTIQQEPKRVLVIDLNNRNMLDKDRNIPQTILQKLLTLLNEEHNLSENVRYNINCLQEESVSKQLLNLFSLCADSNEHFATRDILGAFSYVLTANTSPNDDKPVYYYDAIFMGDNSLLSILKRYDPVYLSTPLVDENLWNGEITDGWLFDKPERWPNDQLFEDDVEGALDLFKSIKRKYYFENVNGQDLYKLQISENEEYVKIFSSIKDSHERNNYKKRVIASLNKLFLPSMEKQSRCLYIWTTHHYDLSREAAVCVSSSNIDARNLDLVMPEQPKWLDKMEYVPDHLLLCPIDKQKVHLINTSLKLDMIFLRTLNKIDKGYPVELLSPKYEQSVSFFLQQLSRDNELCEENDDNEIIIASRTGRFKSSVYIRRGQQYSFNAEED